MVGGVGKTGKYLIISAIMGLGQAASACAICTSNLSYNFMRFTALWLIVFIVWVSLICLVRYRVRRDPDAILAFKPYVRVVRSYAIVLAILYVVTGFHLAAIVFLPLVLGWTWIRHNNDLKKSSLVTWKFLRSSHYVMAGVLVISIPFSFLLPYVVSEPETRVRHNRTMKDLKSITQSENPEVAIAEIENPFAYVSFDLPVYNVVIQGFGFFYKNRMDSHYKTERVNGKRFAYSQGPDGVFDLSAEVIGNAMRETTDTAELNALRYDATNGTISGGDIWVAW